MRGKVRGIRFTRRVQRPVRVVEQADGLLQPQDAAHALIQHRHRHLAALDQARQVLGVEAALHAQVQAGGERLGRGIAVIGGIAVRDQFHVGGVVGDHHARELPFAAQDVGQQFGIGTGRHAVDVVERGHHGDRAGIEGGLERRQVHIAQGLRRDVHHVVLHAGHHRAIGGEVLRRGQQRIGRTQVAALEATHAGGGERTAQHHVLAGTFGATAPALVAGDVHGRRIGPVQAGSGGFDRSGARGALGQVRLEAGGLAQRNREHGTHAVDHVGGEDHRDAQAALFGRDLLDAAAQFGAHTIEQRADLALAHLLQHLVGIAHVGFRVHVRGERADHVREDTQLADLFLDGHLGNEGFDAIGGHRQSLMKTFTSPAF